MRDILNRDIFMNDLVIYNDSYSLVVGESTLFYSYDKNKYPKIVTNVDETVNVIKVTNYDEFELRLKAILEEDYMRYTQDIIRANSDNIKIGNVYKSGMCFYIYMGMVSQKTRWTDLNGLNHEKDERLHAFFILHDFCTAKTITFTNKSLDIDFLLQYTYLDFKTCKDLNKFLNKAVMVDSFNVTDNSFNARTFNKPLIRNGNEVLVDYELQFDMRNYLEV